MIIQTKRKSAMMTWNGLDIEFDQYFLNIFLKKAPLLTHDCIVWFYLTTITSFKIPFSFWQ